MATTAPAVALHGVTKRFGRLVAVKSLDLAVEPGQVFGFLGLNGAGSGIAPAGGAAAALMLVDYLSRVWKPIRGIARLSPFHYYNPLDLAMGKPLPLGDIGILLGTAAFAVTLAFVLFRRRDI